MNELVSAALKQEELFPIREVSRLTGVNPVTLRAWERRYGLIQPTRTDSGHRLYSQADIEAVRSILAWLERGVAVSKVGKILQRAEDQRAAANPPAQVLSRSEWDEWQQQVRRALAAFDEMALERVYGQIFSTYPLAVVFQDVLMPVWQELLLRQSEFGVTSEWLFLDAFLRGRVLQRVQLTRGQGPTVLLGAVPGQCHELELLVAGVLLSAADLNVVLLPLGQPIEELALVCERRQPQLLVLFSNHPPAADFPRQMERLALRLDCPLALAGEAAELGVERFAGTPVACLGADAHSLQHRLRQCLSGRLDT